MFTRFMLIAAMLMYLSPSSADADMLVFDTGSVMSDIGERWSGPSTPPGTLFSLFDFYASDFDELLTLPDRLSFSNDLRQLGFLEAPDRGNPPNHVPEPVTMVLLGMGLMGLASLRWRKVIR